MQYENPVFISGFPHPDVVRSGEDFYMVTSSAEYVPSVPVYHSKNLLDWELINYVLPKIPFERFNGITRGDGAGAPALRCNDGIFYCLVSFPEEGIFVAETTDPYGKWSLLRPLLVGKGFKSPCPLWANGKCYVVFSFDKKLSGVNSRLAVFETDAGLKLRRANMPMSLTEATIARRPTTPNFTCGTICFIFLLRRAASRAGR